MSSEFRWWVLGVPFPWVACTRLAHSVTHPSPGILAGMHCSWGAGAAGRPSSVSQPGPCSPNPWFCNGIYCIHIFVIWAYAFSHFVILEFACRLPSMWPEHPLSSGPSGVILGSPSQAHAYQVSRSSQPKCAQQPLPGPQILRLQHRTDKLRPLCRHRPTFLQEGGPEDDQLSLHQAWLSRPDVPACQAELPELMEPVMNIC